MSKVDAPDAENPEWTEEDMRNAMTFSQLPESVKRVILKIKRGPQKAPTKVPVSIRLSADVVADCTRPERAGKFAPTRRWGLGLKRGR